MIIRHAHSFRVRYAETDQMGIVYYGNYPTYYEVGRVEALRALGLTYRSLEEDHDLFMPVVHLDIHYIRPLRYDEEIRMETSLVKMENGYIYFRSELYTPDGALANVGKVKLCFVDKRTKRRFKETPAVIKSLIHGNLA